jgi:hypothetical protein
MALIDSFTGAGAGSFAGLSVYLNSPTARGQSFFNTATAVLTSYRLSIFKTGSPTGDVYAKLYAHTGTFGTDSVPTGSPLATSDPIDITTITTSSAWREFTFSTPYEMQASTYYCIIIYFNGGDSSNTLRTRFVLTQPPSHAGNPFRSEDGVSGWTVNDGDMLFEVYGDSPPDKTALTAAINAEYSDGASRTTLALTEADYTTASWTTYTNAIAAAIVVEADEEATQTEIDDATALIGTTKAALVFAGQADLDAAIATASALTETDYTTITWGDLATALALPETTNAEVVTKTGAINDAIAALVLIGDLTALTAEIVSAQSIHDGATEGTEGGQYAAGSKATLQAAIDAAETLTDQDTQEDIDAALVTLQAAVTAFLAGVVLTPSTIYLKGRPRNRYDFTGISLG